MMSLLKDGQDRPFLILFLIFISTSMVCLAWLWAIPSSDKNAIIFGLSIWRLIGGITMLISGMAATIGWVYTTHNRVDWAEWKGFNRYIEGLLLLSFLIFTLSGILLIFSFQNVRDIVLFVPIKQNEKIIWFINLINLVTGRFASILVWLFICSGSFIGFLHFTKTVNLFKIWTGQIFLRWAVVGLILSATLFHWSTIIFQLNLFLAIPGWKWWFSERPYHPGVLLFVPIIISTSILAWFLMQVKRPGWRQWLILWLWGVFIQVGFGYMDGGGWESLRLKYADSIFNRYAMAAAREPGLIESLRNYENWYGQEDYLNTKSPGILIPYYLARTVSDWITPSNSMKDRFTGITQVAAILFPIIGYGVVILMGKMATVIKGLENSTVLAGLLYVCCPNVILVPVFLDQSLYPLLFLSALFLFWLVVERKRLAWSFYAGVVIGFYIYLSFSLLPVILVTMLWMGAAWIVNESGDRKNYIKKVGLIILGFFMCLAILFIGLNFNPVLRYTTAMKFHRETHAMTTGYDRIPDMLLLNNAELFTYVGFPVMVLFILNIIRKVKSIQSGDRSQGVIFWGCFLIMLVFLNVFSQTMGEVQRLWLFIVPVICLFSGEELAVFSKRNKMIVIFILILQLTTTFLLYRYQDFYG